jgi:NAD+ kinase
MAMPIDLVFVRHGESEQNLANKHGRKGDNSLYTKEFMGRHGSQHRLTEKGRKQAKIAGQWLKKHDMGYFDRRYVSDYMRAKETAGLLDLEGHDWYVDHMLREREIGDFDGLPWEERNAREKDMLVTRDTDPFYWIPPNGESIAQMTVRLRQLFDTLHRECFDKRVVVVCHGEVMLAFRQLIERMPLDVWIENGDQEKHPQNRINNCQIFHYTRRNPETGELVGRIEWFRSVCPWDESLSSNAWRHIKRKRFNNEELLEISQRVEPLFPDVKD